VEHIESPRVALVRVHGDLDYASTPRLVEAVSGLPRRGQHLIFDLTGLEFCDSSGLGALIAAYKAATAQATEMYLVAVSPIVETAITVTSLDQVFQIRDDVATALAELAAS
jgi:anti-anti-sigma factor